MKVICSGLSKTGTKSMASALRTLGYVVYDFEEQFHYLGTELLRMCEEGWTVDEVRQLFKGVDAVTDTQGNLLFEELLQAYPEAKVVHTERSSEEEWGKSLEKQLNTIRDHKLLRIIMAFTPTGNKLRRFLNMGLRLGGDGNPIGRIFFPKVVTNIPILRYRQHNARVKAVVPKDQLLEFRLTDGWEPLCKFLGKSVPDEEFPFKNKGASITDEIVETSYIFKPINKEFLIVVSVIFASLAFILYYGICFIFN